MSEGFGGFSFSFPADYDVGSGNESDEREKSSAFKFDFGLDQVMSLDGKVSEPQVPCGRSTREVLLPESFRGDAVEERLNELAENEELPRDMAEDEDEDSEEIHRRKFLTTFSFDLPAFTLGEDAAAQVPSVKVVSDDDDDGDQGVHFAFQLGESTNGGVQRVDMDQMAVDAHALLTKTQLEPTPKCHVSLSYEAGPDDVMAHRYRGRVVCVVSLGHAVEAPCERDFAGYFNRYTGDTYLEYTNGMPQVVAVDFRDAHKLVRIGTEGLTIEELGVLALAIGYSHWKLSNTIWRHIAVACHQNPNEKIGVDHFLILGWTACSKVHKVAALLEDRVDPAIVSRVSLFRLSHC